MIWKVILEGLLKWALDTLLCVVMGIVLIVSFIAWLVS